MTVTIKLTEAELNEALGAVAGVGDSSATTVEYGPAGILLVERSS